MAKRAAAFLGHYEARVIVREGEVPSAGVLLNKPIALRTQPLR